MRFSVMEKPQGVANFFDPTPFFEAGQHALPWAGTALTTLLGISARGGAARKAAKEVSEQSQLIADKVDDARKAAQLAQRKAERMSVIGGGVGLTGLGIGGGALLSNRNQQ